MAERLKIISVGGGWVVNNRHIPALKQSGLFDVIGVVSADRDRAEATAQRHKIPNLATDFDPTKGWQAEADAVMIGTVPNVHFAIARDALLAGKHVLSEKPVTVEPGHATELRDLAKRAGRTFAVVHNFQFSRAAMAFKRDLAVGKIGKIHSIYGVQLCNHRRNIPGWCDELPLGLFYDESPHFYYLFRALAGGDLSWVSGSVWKHGPGRNTPKVVSAEYRGPDSVPVFLHINFTSSITEWHVTVVGEKGTADIDVWRDIYVLLPNDGVHTAKDILMTSVIGAGQHFAGVLSGGIRYALGRHLYGNDEVVSRFHRAIHGEDSLQGMSADEGITVVGMMHELIEKSRYVD